MKIDLSQIDREHFSVTEGIIAGETCYLVNPTESDSDFWTRDNLIFRSSIWNSEGELVSAGFPKFHNYLQSPHLYPELPSIEGIKFMEKVDGASLVISHYKGELIHRTRGTFNAQNLDTGWEINELKKKYPRAFITEWKNGTDNVSLIFEWVSPNNRIILEYKELDIYLIGGICHCNYELITQEQLDFIAKDIGVKRPLLYNFPSIPDAISTIKSWVGKEGVCAYYNGDQSIVKIKADHYLKLHRMKSRLANIKRVLEVFLELNCPTYDEFFAYIEKNFDYELAKHHENNMKLVCGAYTGFVRENEAAREFADNHLRNIERKEAAKIINETLADGFFKSFCFSALNNKKPSAIILKNYMVEQLK